VHGAPPAWAVAREGHQVAAIRRIVPSAALRETPCIVRAAVSCRLAAAIPPSGRRDTVLRRGAFACPRTLAVACDAATDTVPREMVSALREPGARERLPIEVSEVRLIARAPRPRLRQDEPDHGKDTSHSPASGLCGGHIRVWHIQHALQELKRAPAVLGAAPARPPGRSGGLSQAGPLVPGVV